MIEISCGGKLNLSLEVGSRDADGYHYINSLFVPLQTPADIIKIAPKDSGGFNLSCETPIEGENILSRAYREFSRRTGLAPSLEVELVKNIPVGSGLGGGSGDAARFLMWLNDFSGKPLDSGGLLKAAFALGSDVPFFLWDRPCRVSGKGDVVEPVALPWKKCLAVVVWPDLQISARRAYEALDEARGDLALTNSGGGNKNLALSGGAPDVFQYRNDLEAPVFEAWPELAALKENLYVLNAFYAAMSGSGSAIFGLFADAGQAGKAKSALSERYAHAYLASFTGM